jgi:hypothetical protein
MEKIQGSDFMGYYDTISLKAELKGDEKEAAKGVVKSFKFIANNAAKEISQFNNCTSIENGEFTINYYPSSVPPLDFNYRFVGKLKAEQTMSMAAADDKITNYLEIEIYLYRRSMTEDSVELQGTAILGLFNNPYARYGVNGTLDYGSHMNELNSSILFLKGRKI